MFAIFGQLIIAYRVLFENKILHQNISPKTIFVTDEGYKLGGFERAVFY